MQAIDSNTERTAPKDARPDATHRGPDRLRNLAVVCELQGAAMAVQGEVMAPLAAAVGWAGPLALRGALLSVVVVVQFSPYVYFYDLVLPMIGVAVILASGRIRRRPAGVALGNASALVWALPTFGHFANEAGTDHAFALLGPPLLTLFLFMIMRELALARADARA